MAKIVEFRELPLDDLQIGKGQVRLRDVGRDIDELADSIDRVGLLEPILVAPAQTPGKYEIILGQRRVLAHQELGRKTIVSGVLDEHIDEIAAKVLSVTENLIRRDLNRTDLIAVCTYLYRQYTSMRAVAAETGLPYEKVREYVKYDRLIPELKELVDTQGIQVITALRAQDAASTEDEPDPQEAVTFAKAMSSMSGVQQRKIQQAREDNPSVSVEEIIEQAKSGGRITQIVVTLGQQIHTSLGRFAGSEGISIDEAAAQLIENGLSRNGYDTNGGIE